MNESGNQSGGNPPRNFQTDIFNRWNWDASQPCQSLDSLQKSSIDYATDAVNWYNRRKALKQHLAKALRGCAIVLGGVGGVLLICSQTMEFSSGWATATFVLAGTLIGLDRFFGLTDAWIRYIETANELRALLHQFKLDSEEQKSRWRANQPSDEQVAEAMQCARVFVSSVDDLVTEEINLWATQFRRSVTRHNTRVDAAQEQGPTEITIESTNADQGPQSEVPAPQGRADGGT